MNSASDAQNTVYTKPGVLTVWGCLLALAAFLPGVVAWVLVQNSSSAVAAEWAGKILLVWSCLLALGGAAGLAAWVSRRFTLQTQAAQLQALRAQDLRRLKLLQLQGDTLWRSDAEHRLLNEPTAAPAMPLWHRWGLLSPCGLDVRVDGAEGAGARVADAPALQRLLRQQGPELDCRVRELGAESAPSWRWVALACWDAQGRFGGYEGVSIPCTSAEVAGVQGDASMGGGPAAGSASLLGSLADAAQLQMATELKAQMHAQMQAQAFEAQEQASFSYTVSHDLRAPLRVVEGFARILKEDYGRLLDRIGNDHLDRVMGAASRMNSMIDSLLSLSQLSSQPLARQPVNLSQMAEFVLDELQRATPQRRVSLHVQPQMLAHGDPTLLRLVLENLLGNAWKYSSKCEQAEIRFEAQRDETADAPWIYRVSDNGAGFDMRFADRLFGVFQRLHSASDFQGTGVGLASVRRIVRRHGGEIWAESEVGAGARFYFTLPGG
ncbi:sensor histidine kinase [Roseateles koreensis]|uniref:histidine kinase n=1 Tax=Roseateles koreensis TaxID=2987526 RepID=A0ABT5KR69_9BURK|nr:ATP-binding protein [Roseateles koreensis]MDC8784282.1 ATP-binding protein [Roseateles koreensis]